MLRLPEFTDYIARNASYEHFISITIFFAILVTLVTMRFAPKGKSINMPLNIWLILGLGLLIRTPLMFQGYWYDETFTSAITQVKIGNFLTAVSGDVHPPLYYLIVRFFVFLFEHDDISMRLPALLSSLGLILTTYQIALNHHDKRVAMWSALIAALLPALVYYGSEARYPAFMTLMLSLAYIGIQKRHNLLFSLSLAIAGLVHVNAWFYILVMSAIWLFQYRRISELILPFASIAIWLPFALNQAKDVSDGFWLVQYVPYRHLIEMSIGTRFLSAESAFIPIIISVAIIGLSIWYWRKHVNWLWLAIVVAVPMMQWITGLIWHPIYLPRTLLMSIIPIIIPVAFWMQTRANKILAAGGFIALFVAIGSMYIMDRTAASDKAIAACEGYSLIYATNVHTAILARHYSEETVFVYEYGNSTAQQLPHSSQAVLFDGIGNIFEMQITDICIVSQVSVFNSDREIEHLEEIITSYSPTQEIVASRDGKLGYYLILRINED